jgi:2-oxoacid:acceptor oxidoreductase gamma subunit (pyruvate/2-ketoisovalerate family)
MLEIKLHGRGGQGVVVASQILARAFFLMGMYPQCYSLFGGERRGAPVTSFLRVDGKKILLKCEIKRPDQMIFMAPDLINEREIDIILKPKGLILINTSLTADQFSRLRTYQLSLVDASSIAEQVGLGRTINTAVLGAYCRANSSIPMTCLESAIKEAVPTRVEINLEAARRAYEVTQVFPVRE